ncbi:hypothetical protein [Fodinibius saliphilus]|uniref:hypothetical protein n=1 Tax=Fodinibius saliphilus TaxID=1920650 RepID=UPI001108B6E8|nr:hypothetical protein [Fodinibius saliphilus]
MPQLPFEIPQSLASYAEHFDNDPIKATTRLKKQLQKRGPDAVGHFLLAWFYHLKGLDEQAIEEALKARMFAPGSPFFEKLHYYLSHPNTFKAWTPEDLPNSSSTDSSTHDPGPVLDLDNLIQKLSRVESKRIKPGKMESEQSSKKEGSSDNVDDIASETLASIHEKQGKFDTAINTYKRLKKRYQEKEDQYNKKIQRLQELKKENKEKE